MDSGGSGADAAWTSENHWRRTFCQIPFTDIYAHAEQGKRSLLGLVAFFRRKALAERAASDELRVLLQTPPPLSSNASSSSSSLSASLDGALEELEESGSSIRRALAEVKSFVDAACNHQLLLATVLEEQVAEPLAALQEASEVYVRVLRDEIKSVNDAYAAAAAAHRHAATWLRKAMDELADARERQRTALHGIGVPAFELQRLAARVAKCEDEKLQAEVAKAQSKSALYHRIVARDEMAMAVSVAYQKAEEERLDQLRSSLQRFLHVEKDRLKVATKTLAVLEEHINHIDRSEDIQLLIHVRARCRLLACVGRGGASVWLTVLATTCTDVLDSESPEPGQHALPRQSAGAAGLALGEDADRERADAGSGALCGARRVRRESWQCQRP